MLLLLWALLQVEPDVRGLLEGLTDDRVAVRASAEAKLWDLPARLLPRVLEEAARHEEQEILAVAGRMRIAPAWSAFLPGSIRDARGLAERLGQESHPERGKAISLALERLAALPPGEVPGLLLQLLDEPEEGARSFALSALRRHPPADPAPLLPFLRAEKTSGLAAEVLVAMEATSAVPLAVELFCREGPATLGAARILERYGAGEHAARIAAVVKERVGLIVWGIRILRATGRSAEPLLVDLAEHVSAPRQKEIAEALVEVGSDRSLPLLRTLLSDLDPGSRDLLLAQALDPEWARERLERARAGDAADLRGIELSAVGGPALRPLVREWAAQPGLKVGLRRDLLLPLLGACGTADDAPLLLEALHDPRLAESAADALDRIGDPRHARAVFEAALRCGFQRADRLLSVLPPDDLEDGLLEVLRDPRGYAAIGRPTLALVERRPRPALRAACFALLEEPSTETFGLKGEILALLLRTAAPSDAAEFARLRSSREPFARTAALLFAWRSGDEAAGPALIEQISRASVPLETRTQSFLDLAERPGWPALVRAQWLERRLWPDGMNWLAAHGDAEARAAVREQLKRNVQSAQAGLTALARGGEPEALEQIRTRALQGSIADERLAVETADDAFRRRVLTDVGRPSGLRLAALLRLPEAAPRFVEAASRTRDLSIEPVVAALGAMKPPGTADALHRLLRSPVPELRAAAALAAAELGDRSLLPRLGRLLDDPAELRQERRRVWHAAMEALERFYGTPSEGPSVAARRAFWRARLANG